VKKTCPSAILCTTYLTVADLDRTPNFAERGGKNMRLFIDTTVPET